MDLELDKLVDMVVKYYCQPCDNRTTFEVRIEKSQKVRIFYLPDTNEWENELDADDETTQIHIFCGTCGTELVPPEPLDTKKGLIESVISDLLSSSDDKDHRNILVDLLREALSTQTLEDLKKWLE